MKLILKSLILLLVFSSTSIFAESKYSSPKNLVSKIPFYPYGSRLELSDLMTTYADTNLVYRMLLPDAEVPCYGKPNEILLINLDITASIIDGKLFYSQNIKGNPYPTKDKIAWIENAISVYIMHHFSTILESDSSAHSLFCSHLSPDGKKAFFSYRDPLNGIKFSIVARRPMSNTLPSLGESGPLGCNDVYSMSWFLLACGILLILGILIYTIIKLKFFKK